MLILWEGQLLNAGLRYLSLACQAKVRMAGMGVSSRAAWGASSLKCFTCRQESASVIVIDPRSIDVSNKYMKVSFSSNKEKAQTKCTSCAERGRPDLHTSVTALCCRNGIRYTCQPNACPMPHMPWHWAMACSSIGLLTRVLWPFLAEP